MAEKTNAWFETIARIANSQNPGKKYVPEDVRNILKAWRKQYHEKQATAKAELAIVKYEAKLKELKAKVAVG